MVEVLGACIRSNITPYYYLINWLIIFLSSQCNDSNGHGPNYHHHSPSQNRTSSTEPQNAEQVIQDQRRVIENLKAQVTTKERRIQQLEDQVRLLTIPQKNSISLYENWLSKVLYYYNSKHIIRVYKIDCFAVCLLCWNPWTFELLLLHYTAT